LTIRDHIQTFIRNYNHIVKNFLSLSILNGLNFVLPLISLPYLVRVLGPEKYGSFAFASVIIQYSLLISNYGFAFSGTKLISENRNKLNEVSQIFWSIIIIRLLITLALLIILGACILVIPKLHTERLLYVFALGIVFGDIFMPTWFFQGVEKMQYITIINSSSKIVFTVLIFFFVKKIADYPIVMLLNSFGYLVGGFLSMLITFKVFKLNFRIPSKKKFIFILKDGWYIFISTININFYRNANVFLLGVLTNDTVVGIYSSAEKIVKALQSLFTPVSDALFPHLSLRFSSQEISKSINNLIKISKYYFALLFTCSALLFVCSKFIVDQFLGMKFQKSVSDLRILSWIILLGCLNYLLGIIGLINLGEKRNFALFVLIAGFSSFLTSIILIHYFNDVGASIGMLLGEFILFILCSRLLYSKFKTSK
jgi:polysaccharide transporter, PST family